MAFLFDVFRYINSIHSKVFLVKARVGGSDGSGLHHLTVDHA